MRLSRSEQLYKAPGRRLVVVQLLGSLMIALLGASLLNSCKGDPLAEGQQHFNNRRYDMAIESYRLHYVNHPYSPTAGEALWRIGNIYRLRMRNFKKAAEVYRILVNRFPESDQARDAQQHLGDLYARHLNDHQQAIVEFQRVVSNRHFDKSQRAHAVLATANSYLALGNFEQARLEYNRVIHDMDVQDQELIRRAKLQLGHSYDAAGECDKAMPIFASFFDPGNAEVKIAGGENEDSKIETVANSEESVKISNDMNGDPIVLEARFGYAACLEQAQRYEDALAQFELLAEQHPNPSVVELRLERVRRRMMRSKR